MKLKSIAGLALIAGMLFSCTEKKEEKEKVMVDPYEAQYIELADNTNMEFEVEQFADVKVLRYEIPGFDELTLKEQKLVYYLTQAGLSGRDIMWDQNYRHNLTIRKALENVYVNYEGDKESDDWKAFETYIKRVWFSNGIHHHYSNDKLKPAFDKSYLVDSLLATTNTELN